MTTGESLAFLSRKISIVLVHARVAKQQGLVNPFYPKIYPKTKRFLALKNPLEKKVEKSFN